ncbi:MAG: DUF4168 domain-containing protein [Pseudohongiellaceae bacterium]
MRILSIQNLIAAAGLALVVSSGANAQQQGQPQGQPPPAQQQPQVELDEQTLSQFANALGSVTEIQVEYSESIGATQDPEEAQELQQEAQTKMVEAVEEAGLDVQTYNMIAQQMSADPELQQRIQEML